MKLLKDGRVRLALDVPPELKEKLRKIAKNKGLTMNAIITMLITDYVNVN